VQICFFYVVTTSSVVWDPNHLWSSPTLTMYIFHFLLTTNRLRFFLCQKLSKVNLQMDPYKFLIGKCQFWYVLMLYVVFGSTC
jgi:hypothetical protein